MVRGVDLTAAPPDGEEPWWRGAGRLMAQGDVLRTGVTVGLTGEPGKRLGDLRAFSGWWDRLRCCQALCSGLRWPEPMEHQAQPHEGDQHQLIEKEVGYHGKAPSHK